MFLALIIKGRNESAVVWPGYCFGVDVDDFVENSNTRLTSISSSQKVFKDAILPYQKALAESSYNHKSTDNPQSKRNKSRHTDTIWYYPTWNANAKTNLERIEVPKHHLQMLPKRAPPTQVLQKTHTEALLSCLT